MEIEKVLIEVKDILRESKIDEREARLLIAHSLNTSKEELFKLKEVSQNEYEKIVDISKKRASRSSLCLYYRL